MEDTEVERRMQPGAWSEHGFLLAGASLRDVRAEDLRLLSSLGVEPSAIADRLLPVLAAGRASDWARPVAGNGDCQIEILRVRGFITCPWAPDQFQPCTHGYGGRPTANQFRITHLPSGLILEGSELTVHMIGAHGFFGGPGTPFRIDPERAARVAALAT